MKSGGIALPKVHGAKKILNINVLPEKQNAQLQNKKEDENRQRLCEGSVV